MSYNFSLLANNVKYNFNLRYFPCDNIIQVQGNNNFRKEFIVNGTVKAKDFFKQVLQHYLYWLTLI